MLRVSEGSRAVAHEKKGMQHGSRCIPSQGVMEILLTRAYYLHPPTIWQMLVIAAACAAFAALRKSP